MPIIKALAVHAIESVLGVETRATVWRKHLYELAGLKRVFGNDLVASFTKGENVTLPAKVDLPAISIELRKRAPYNSLTKLEPIALLQDGSTVLLVAQSADQCFQFQCHMDFANERLNFDIQRGIGSRDDGTAECAERMADLHRFIYDYLCNGELRILNAVTGELLSRKDAFLPLNCRVNDEVCTANIEHWKTTAQRRHDQRKDSPKL